METFYAPRIPTAADLRRLRQARQLSVADAGAAAAIYQGAR
jgi:hypothetical protein